MVSIVIIPILRMSKMGPREVKECTQGHTASVWSCDVNSESLAVELEGQYLLFTTCCFTTCINVQEKNPKYFLPLATSLSLFLSFTDKFLERVVFTTYHLLFLASSSIETPSPLKWPDHPQPLHVDFRPDFSVALDVPDCCLFNSLLPWVSHGFLPISLALLPRLLFSLCLALLLTGLFIVLVPQASICAQVFLLLTVSLGEFIRSLCCPYANTMLMTLQCVLRAPLLLWPAAPFMNLLTGDLVA